MTLAHSELLSQFYGIVGVAKWFLVSLVARVFCWPKVFRYGSFLWDILPLCFFYRSPTEIYTTDQMFGTIKVFDRHLF